MNFKNLHDRLISYLLSRPKAGIIISEITIFFELQNYYQGLKQDYEFQKLT